QLNFPRRKLSSVQKVLFASIILIIIFIIYYLLKIRTIGKDIEKEKESTPEPTTRQTYSSSTPTTPSTTQPQTTCGIRVNNESEVMIKVGERNSYVIGSYVEHRLQRKMIRTVAIVHRSEIEREKYYCVFCCDGRNFSVAATCSIHPHHFGFDYGEADFFCPIPRNCATPAHVAITYRTQEGDGSLWNIQSFQPVGNQQPRTENFPYDFTVCISVMFDYSNVLQFVQTMEMYKILGVQKVAIYRTSCSPDIQKVLDYYVDQGFVDVIPWTVNNSIRVSRSWKKFVSPGDLEYYGQIVALTDCLYRYMYESRYIALLDLDELIMPSKEDNLKALFARLEMNYPAGHPCTRGCLWNKAADNGFVEDYRVPDFDYDPPNTGAVVLKHSHDEPAATNMTPDNNFEPSTGSVSKQQIVPPAMDDETLMEAPKCTPTEDVDGQFKHVPSPQHHRMSRQLLSGFPGNSFLCRTLIWTRRVIWLKQTPLETTKRASFTNASNVVELLTPIHSDIFFRRN
ncbi:hypothetical protein NFI96_023206, partial [Prochilodus magdalenae]